MVTVRVGSNPIQVRLGEQTSLASSMAAAAAAEADAAALSAATAEAASGPTYASTAAGLAATTSGEAFAVDNGDGTVTVYLNSAGVAVEQRTLATTAALASTDAGKGAALVAFKQDGDGSVHRTSEAKLREAVTPQDFGAVANGAASATEHVAFESALSALRNADDAFFSRSLALPTGVYHLTAPVDLPQSFGRVYGSPNALVRGATGEHVLRADGVSFVSSNISRLSIYGGVDSIHAGTSGEIAQLFFDELYIGAHTGTALYFAGGLTSSRLTRLTVEGIFSPSGHGLHCDGGINNNNVLGDCDFFNVSGDVVRVENQANGWQIRNVHMEGQGKAGAVQYHLEAPIACHIIGGWSEASHEYLVRTTAQGDPLAAGVIIDGLVSIGSVYGGGGFVGSKFDTGTNRIILGSNHWDQPTTAPARCFIYGVNRKLRTNSSHVWTRDIGEQVEVVAPLKTPSSSGDLTFDLLTVTRPNTAADVANQQTMVVEIDIPFHGFEGGGNLRYGYFRYEVVIAGNSNATIAATVSAATVVGSAASVTCTVQLKAGATAGTATLEAVIAGLNTGLPNSVRPGFVVKRNMSRTEADRFEVAFA